MRANVFCGINEIRVEEVNRPHAGVGEAVIRVTLTTIRGTITPSLEAGNGVEFYEDRANRLLSITLTEQKAV